MMGIHLIPITEDVLAAFRESPAQLETVLGTTLGPAKDSILHALEQTAVYLLASRIDPDWGCFLAVDVAASHVVGTCAYKGAPAADGTVEVAYCTFPLFEGRGYATMMARALCERAGNRRVIAHTLPTWNASCRVLQKAGFVRSGETMDPEDGLVWRWEATEENSVASTSQPSP